ncbi:MAG TPA: fumarylacetoacetate hydrolase family protein [Candidatus Aquicultor sp.]
MKFVRFSYGGPVAFGLLEGNTVRLIKGNPLEDYTPTKMGYPLDKVRLLEPVLPSKIICVGLNYTDHAAELGMAMHDNPIIFLKPPSSVTRTNDDIIYPEMSQQVDYEGELAIVIKGIARKVSVGRAKEHIMGYTCANDVTARDLQNQDGQWTRAKSFDTFAPIGPCIETEIDPSDLHIETRVNGEVKQSSTTANMYFKPDYLVSFISNIMTLCPGDVILTGTPPGVGPIQPGDQVEVEIEGIGMLSNKVTRP